MSCLCKKAGELFLAIICAVCLASPLALAAEDETGPSDSGMTPVVEDAQDEQDLGVPDAPEEPQSPVEATSVVDEPQVENGEAPIAEPEPIVDVSVPEAAPESTPTDVPEPADTPVLAAAPAKQASDASETPAQEDAAPIAEKPSLAKAKVTTSARKLYNGKRIKPKVKVTLGGEKLKLNRDFKVTYKNNKKVGKATIVVKGIGAYTGKIEKKFKIVSKLVIAVPDRSASSASGLMRYLRSMGFKAVWVHSAKINPAKYDGLAIPGDPSDVDPRFYGEKNKHAHTPHPKTEKMQFKLIKKFANANKPVLGICKGCQIINVAYGGSLHQDLGGYHRLWQTTHIKKGSWLRKKLDATVSVYHYHHQAVKRLAKNFKVMAWSKKGNKKIIEGIEHTSLPVWGIQFHPENSGKYAKIIGKMYKREVIKRM